MPEVPECKRFWAKVDLHAPNGCWQWLAGKTPNGYGLFWLKEVGNNVLAHRYAYQMLKGVVLPPASSDVTLDHLCRNPSCVNPAHMEVVTRGENVLRGNGPTAKNARKVVCIRGHAFDGRCMAKGKMRRYCKTCHRVKVDGQRSKKLSASAGVTYA